MVFSLQSLQSNRICINRAEYLANGSQYTLQQNLSPGNYSLRVKAQSQADFGEFSPLVYFYIEEQSSGSSTQFVIFGLIALLVGINLFYFLWADNCNDFL